MPFVSTSMRKTFRKPVQAYIFVAVHAKTFQLHNTSILISVHQVTGLLEGRLRGIVRLSVSGHDEVCACVCLVGVEYVTDFGDAKRKKKKKKKSGVASDKSQVTRDEDNNNEFTIEREEIPRDE